MIALTGYRACFDASYQKTPDGSHTIVAGYLATIEQWEQWETNWKLVLAEFNVPYFKMSEFIGRREGAYADVKWKSETYRARFLAKLAAVTRDWVDASFATLLSQRVFDFHNLFYELDQHYNPYALCGRDCGIRTMNFIREERDSNLPIDFIFERGDEGRGMLMEGMLAAGLRSPVFSKPRPDLKNPQADIDDPPVLPLQACDLVAYEIGRGQTDFKLGKKSRKSLEAVGQIKIRRWNELKEQDVMTRINNGRIPLRDGVKHLANPMQLLKPTTFQITLPSKSKRPQKKK
ncbi:MAG TPA: hypothetical protein VI685_24295 [Candidatus Angelobacter sp.]